METYNNQMLNMQNMQNMQNYQNQLLQNQQQMLMMQQMQPQITGSGTPISAIRNDIPPSKPKTQEQRRTETDDSRTNNRNIITNLVSDINRDLENFVPSKLHETEESDGTDTEKETINENSYSKYIPQIIKEPILLLAIYLLMSQNFVRNLLATYITYLNPRDDGSIPFLGIFIYGAILVIIYTIFKKILI